MGSILLQDMLIRSVIGSNPILDHPDNCGEVAQGQSNVIQIDQYFQVSYTELNKLVIDFVLLQVWKIRGIGSNPIIILVIQLNWQSTYVQIKYHFQAVIQMRDGIKVTSQKLCFVLYFYDFY